MKVGIIDVGGGYRGIYCAGVLDFLLDNKIEADLVLGISAGSANVISYAAKQARRNFKFYTEYGLRKEYASAKNFLTKGTFVDLDYVYSTLSNSNGEYPLDYEAIKNTKMEVYVQASDALTAKPVLFTKDNIKQDDYSIFKASSALPVVCKPYEVDGKLYFDGGIVDPLPIKQVLKMGCDKVIVLLTMPLDEDINHEQDVLVARILEKQYPVVANKLKGRAKLYRRELNLAKSLEASGKVKLIYPDDISGMKTLTRDYDILKSLYNKGYNDGSKIIDFLKEETNDKIE